MWRLHSEGIHGPKVFNEGGTDLKGNAGRNCEWDYGNLIEHPKNENIFALNLRNFQG